MRRNLNGVYKGRAFGSLQSLELAIGGSTYTRA
jgi:hypothetical protein